MSLRTFILVFRRKMPLQLVTSFTSQLAGRSTLQLLQIHQVICRWSPADLETFSSFPSTAGVELPVQPALLAKAESSFTLTLKNKTKPKTLEQDGSKIQAIDSTHTLVRVGGGGCGPLHSKPANNWGWGPITAV